MKTIALAVTLCAVGKAGAIDTGLTVQHAGGDNTLVRIDGPGRYVLMPVQEAIDDARVDVIVDGRLEQTLYVRLAKTRTDYMVPLDISAFNGRDVVLNIVSPHDRSSQREAAQDVCWHGMALSDTFDIADRETRYRPLYHHTPQYGWMNDPNGMFYADGKWHLYYQYNPYGSKWQNMSWGHSVSTDLVHWQPMPVVLRPDAWGSIFSGSCVVDSADTAGYGAGTVVALYTSAGQRQLQSRAVSHDGGNTFAVDKANPILVLDSEARDPNVFYNSHTGRWNMVLAHPLQHEVLFFSSDNLADWTYESAFGAGLGAQDGVWECPDLIELPVEGTDTSRWLLIVNINPGAPFGGSGIQYFTGMWDGHTFNPDTEPDGTVISKWLDFGKDNYALVTWSGAPDGRRTAIGWMSNWQYAGDVPTMQYRSANTLPVDLGLFCADDGRIYAKVLPAPEVDALRGNVVAQASRVTIGAKGIRYGLPRDNDGVCEIIAEINASAADTLVFCLSNEAGDVVTMTYDRAGHSFSFDRMRSGVVDFSENFPAVTVAPTFETDGRLSLRMFIDRSSIEVFGNNGRFAMTNLVFPNKPYSILTINAVGGKARIEKLDIYNIKH